ncbi:CHAD domain-containing protein [Streptomyces sp. NPDC006879]|uniref:CHAD domain-containing protein n=1 Tax=Streptomyces sp. NPDC006879 TaxID=3364767 RepID=UPI0036B5D53E
MAQRNHEGETAGDLLGDYLRNQAMRFLRGLRLHECSGADAAEASDASEVMRGASRRISGALLTFRPVTDPPWADGLRTELIWVSGVLADEHAYASRLARLLEALHRLSGSAAPQIPAARGAAGPRGGLALGAARAAALLDRQLTLARTRAHSATLQAFGSARFHAVADAVAVLASEVQVDPVAARGDVHQVLVPLASVAESRLAEAVCRLPEPSRIHDEAQDAFWHTVRRLLRTHRYALEVLGEDVTRLATAGEALDRHRDAAEAASASALAARTPRIAPATAYALGVLHADQRHEVEAARLAFQHVWQRSAVRT